MDFTPFDSGSSLRMSTTFVLMCLRHGFRPQQFQLSFADAVDCDGIHTVLERELVITQIACGRRRRYHANQLRRALDAFEDDLRAGVFITWDYFDFI